MGRLRAFTLGWYGHGNLGDEAFKPAICKLLPEVDFTFGDSIPKNINQYDFLLVGGGSFLDAPISNPGRHPINIPVGFVGVGLSEALHKTNKPIISKSKLVLVRDTNSQQFCPGSVQAPDLVFNTDPFYKHAPVGKKVTIILNDFVTPNPSFPDWKFISYQWFLCEFGEVCNELIRRGYSLQFMPMGTGDIDDRRVAAAVIGRLDNKKKANWFLGEASDKVLQKEIAESEFTITMRFHGMVYSTLVGAPFICISSHDKMTGLGKDMGWNGMVDYYGFNKSLFYKTLSSLQHNNVLQNYARKAKEQWQLISATSVREFYLSVSQSSRPLP